MPQPRHHFASVYSLPDVPGTAEQPRKAPPVTKTVLQNLPEKRSFKAAAVRGKVYVFDYEDDELARSEDLSARGAVYA